MDRRVDPATLPPELFYMTTSYLTPKQIIGIQRVSKEWQARSKMSLKIKDLHSFTTQSSGRPHSHMALELTRAHHFSPQLLGDRLAYVDMQGAVQVVDLQQRKCTTYPAKGKISLLILTGAAIGFLAGTTFHIKLFNGEAYHAKVPEGQYKWGGGDGTAFVIESNLDWRSKLYIIKPEGARFCCNLVNYTYINQAIIVVQDRCWHIRLHYDLQNAEDGVSFYILEIDLPTNASRIYLSRFIKPPDIPTTRTVREIQIRRCNEAYLFLIDKKIWCTLWLQPGHRPRITDERANHSVRPSAVWQSNLFVGETAGDKGYRSCIEIRDADKPNDFKGCILATPAPGRCAIQHLLSDDSHLISIDASGLIDIYSFDRDTKAGDERILSLPNVSDQRPGFAWARDVPDRPAYHMEGSMIVLDD